MSNYNKVILMGNLCRDVEVRYTPKGTAIAVLSLAVNREYTADGEKKKDVLFVDVEAWGKQAETLGQYLSKGRPLFVDGRLKLDQWDDKESGQKRSKLKVVMESFQFIGGASVERKEESAPRPPAKPASDSPDAAPASDDNVPF